MIAIPLAGFFTDLKDVQIYSNKILDFAKFVCKFD